LARLFRQETGMSFGAWRQQARLIDALGRLAAGQPVTDVALDLGYQSPSAFTSMFRRALGRAPTHYFMEG
jgi:AraC-like DNA-binding protein